MLTNQQARAWGASSAQYLLALSPHDPTNLQSALTLFYASQSDLSLVATKNTTVFTRAVMEHTIYNSCGVDVNVTRYVIRPHRDYMCNPINTSGYNPTNLMVGDDAVYGTYFFTRQVAAPYHDMTIDGSPFRSPSFCSNFHVVRQEHHTIKPGKAWEFSESRPRALRWDTNTALLLTDPHSPTYRKGETFSLFKWWGTLGVSTVTGADNLKAIYHNTMTGLDDSFNAKSNPRYPNTGLTTTTLANTPGSVMYRYKFSVDVACENIGVEAIGWAQSSVPSQVVSVQTVQPYVETVTSDNAYTVAITTDAVSSSSSSSSSESEMCT